MAVVDELIRSIENSVKENVNEKVNKDDVNKVQNKVSEEITKYELGIYKVVKGFLLIVLIITAIYILWKILKSL